MNMLSSMSRRSGWCWGAAMLALMSATGLMAQAKSVSREFAPETLPNGLRLLTVQVDKANKVSLALALPVGWRHDPAGKTGLAEVMRWWIRLSQRRQVEGHRFTVEARPDHTTVSHTGPARFFVERIEFLLRLLGNELVGDQDLRALAVGRARLAADDLSRMVPGYVIRQKAWRSLCAGVPLGRQNYGIPEEIGGLSQTVIEQRLLSHYGPDGAALVLIGDFNSAELRDARKRLARLSKRDPDRTALVHDSAPAFEASTTHPRVDGPYVSAVLLSPAPSHPDFLPFVLGMTVLRSRAFRRFGAPRGNEWRAEFPYMAFDYWDGDRLVLVNRRGHNKRSAELPRQEIGDLFAEVRRRAFHERQLVAARLEVASILAVPPFDHASGPLLVVRARRLAMSLCLEGWPLDLVDKIEQVSAADVHRVMGKYLSPNRLRWFELNPTAETVEFLRTRRR